MKFQIIAADPPWDYAGQKQHAGKGKVDSGGAILHYSTMPTKKIIEEFSDFVNAIADKDCLLFMWSTWPHLNQAIELGQGWGFKYVHTPFIWNKMRTNPGYYTLTQTEPVLCFKRGKIPQPRGSRCERQLVEQPRTLHSEKPDEVYARIEKMFPTQNKIELFARKPRQGWQVWGNEVISYEDQ